MNQAPPTGPDLLNRVKLVKACQGVAIFERLTGNEALHTNSDFTLTDSANKADIILFLGSDLGNFADIRQNEVFKQFSSKSYVVDEGDFAIPYLPGVYTGIDRFGFLNGWTISGFYSKVAEWDDLDSGREISSPEKLFSFVGRFSTDRVRSNLATLESEEAIVLNSLELGPTADRRKIFLESLFSAKFVLCPRGLGPSSFRIFETLRAGRVPVVISDNWVPPDGPDWDKFSVRVPERFVKDIPELLHARAHQWDEMAHFARAVYDEWFSGRSGLGTVIRWCLQLHRGMNDALRVRCQLAAQMQRLRPSFVQRKLKRSLSGDPCRH